MATIESEVFSTGGSFDRGPTGVTRPTGQSAAIRDVLTLIGQVAAHESSVLVLGASGTGKEVVARAIHEASPRRHRPFIAVNCGAIPSELLESELFGHEKGAFTGAVAARKGRFELAEGGTLFLDEIGDMSLPMQVKLLRVLQERVFERVGSALQYRCNVRIIAATHRNLEEAILKGGFREDLFYRLNVFPIEMPSLRARIEDLPTLIADFAALNVAAGRPRVTLSEAALDCLRAHAWPGNVRELGNLVERLSIVCGGRIVTSAELPPRYRPAGWTYDAAKEGTAAAELAAFAAPVAAPVAVAPVRAASAVAGSGMAADAADDAAAIALSEREALMMLEGPVAADGNILPPEGLDLRLHIATIEESLIRQALSRSDGIVAQAARLLGLRRTTLVEKLRKFDPAAGALLPED